MFVYGCCSKLVKPFFAIWFPCCHDWMIWGVPHFRNHQKKRHGHPKVYQLPRWNGMKWPQSGVARTPQLCLERCVFHLPRALLKGSRFGCQGADANVQAQNPKSHPSHPAVGVGIFLNLALITPKLLGLVGKLWNYTKCVKWRQLMVKWYDGMMWNGWKRMGCRIIRRRVIIIMWSR